jgi:NADH:ubiquinone oxidoreductase subunit 3 (subunit A)
MLVFILSSCILACLIFIVSYLLAPKALYNEKVHGYECGFIPYGTPRVPFEIHFYIVSILFIVFDLEIVYLVP